MLIEFSSAEIKALVETYGGTFSATVTPDCTHLVSAQKEVDSKAKKSELPLPYHTAAMDEPIDAPNYLFLISSLCYVLVNFGF
jgi:hypothetical protein